MSEGGQQEAYQGEHQNPAEQQQLAVGHSEVQANHKRKREAIEDSAEPEDGRANTDGSTSSRRTSFKTSPGMSFMPINPNSPQNTYAYQPLNVAPQHSPNAMNGSSASDAATAALAANAMNNLMPGLSAGIQYGSTDSKPPVGGDPQQHVPMESSAFANMSPQPVEGHTEGVGVLGGAQQQQQHNAHPSHPPPAQQPQQQPQRVAPANPKPQVGTEEWHRVRRDNHKEVERRRRETINEGINELAKIVPGCEKNKGSILQRAVQYIQQLKENEAQNIEKWTLEKLLTEQAISDLSQRNEKLQKEIERAWREAETWKQTAENSGSS